MFGIFFIIGVILVILGAHFWERSSTENIGFACYLLCTLFFVISFIGIFTYIDSVANYGKLEGTRNSLVSYERVSKQVKDAYYVIDKSQLLSVSKELPVISLGLENLKQSTNVSESLTAIRDTILKYNVLLGRYHSAMRNWFTRMFIAKIPEGLEPITISENVLGRQ